ncbi:MAG: bacterial Ig-like domain-containing protein, partial [Clostridia bacterium]|nr:bacterial Ig-like domain-containing protein [Clostridia bacterium]
MFTAGMRRVLCFLTVAMLLVVALCITAVAEDVEIAVNKAETTAAAKYDPENPTAGGWLMENATVSKGTLTINRVAADKQTGFEDSAARFGNFATDALATYILPEEEQFAIKGYGKVSYFRRAQGGTSFLSNYGTTYQIILTMTDGQKVTITEKWYENFAERTTVTSDMQEQIDALEGNPILASISFRPYASDADLYYRNSGTHLYYTYDAKVQAKDADGKPLFEEDGKTPIYQQATDEAGNLLFEEDGITPVYVYETKTNAGTYVYYCFTSFNFLETTDIPVLSSEMDSYNGVTVTEHNGKITGLDPELTYTYGPVYTNAPVTVTGVTEITGLVGGVYEITATEEGKAVSSAAYVVVHKYESAVKDLKIAETNTAWGVYDDATPSRAIKSFEPISGYWICPSSDPYNAENTLLFHTAPRRLRGEFDSAVLNYFMANNETAGEYYRHNIHRETYVFTPEEQFYADNAIIKFQTGMGLNSFKCDFSALTFAAIIHADGQGVEPYFYEGTYANINSPAVELHIDDPAFEGKLITRIDLIPLWDVPSVEEAALASTSDKYSRVRNFSTTNFEAPKAPTYSIVGDENGGFKLVDLVNYYTYQTSTDGYVWSDAATAAELHGFSAGESFYIRALGTNNVPSSAILVEIPAGARAQSESGVFAIGKELYGFKNGYTYEYAPYNIFGFGEWSDYSSSAELTNGVYAFRIKANGTTLAGAESYVLIDDGTNKLDYIYLDPATSKYDVNTTVTDGNKVGPFDEPGIWSSDRTYSVLRDYISSGALQHTATEAKLQVNGDLLPALNIEAHQYAQTFNYNYASLGSQMIPIEDLGHILVNFSAGGYIGLGSWEGKTLSDYMGSVRIYVAGGSASYYDIAFPWVNSDYKTIKVNELLPEDASGYVIGISIRPWGATPADWEVQDGYSDSDPTAAWQGRLLYSYMNLKPIVSVTPAPSINVYENADGSFSVNGLNPDLSYFVSTDGESFTALEAGSTSYDIPSEGVYYFRSLGSGTVAMSPITAIEVKADAVPTGFELVGGRLLNLDSDKYYEYAKFDVSSVGMGEFEEYDSSIVLDAGLYAIRTIDTKTGYYSPSTEVFVLGEKYGTIGNVGTNPTTNRYISGQWNFISSPALSFSAATTTNPHDYNFQHYVAYASQERYINGKYVYELTSDELIPLDKFQSMSLGRYNNMATHVQPFADGRTVVKGAVTFYVYGGEQESYKVPFDWSTGLSTKISNTLTINATKGYIYRIDIDILDEDNPANEGYILSAENQLYQHQGKGAWYSYQMWSVGTKKDADATRRGYVAVPRKAAPVLAATGTDTDGVFVIEGFDAKERYAYSADGNSYTDLAAGTTSIEVGEGTYYFYTKSSDISLNSVPVTITTDGVMPAPKLSFDKETLTVSGFDTSLAYEWAKFDLNKSVVWSPLTLNDDGTYVIDEGIYLFRTAATDSYVPSKFVQVHTIEEGANKGTVSFNYKNDKAYTKGKWSINNLNIAGYDSGASGRFWASWTVKTTDIPYWMYQFADDEIFALSELSSFTAESLTFSNGVPYDKSITPYIVITVAGGEKLEYIVEGKEVATKVFVFDFDTLHGSRKLPGYVIAVELHYYTPEVQETLNITKPGTSYPVFRVPGMIKATANDLDTNYTDDFVQLLNASPIESLTVNGAKTAYCIGDEFEMSGMTVTANYADGTTSVVTNKVGVSGFDTTTVGTKTVTLTYKDVPVSYDITVSEIELASIAVEKLPDKTKYSVGEPFSAAGIKIVAIYNNGDTVDVTADAVIGTADTSEAGKKTVTVTYEGKATSFDVFVKSFYEKPVLTVVDGIITGLDPTLAYEYRVLSVNNATWTTLEAGNETLTVDAGIWAIRAAEDDNHHASDVVYVTVKSNKYGSIAWGPFDTTTSDFVQGKWTDYTRTTYINPYNNYQGIKALRMAIHWTASYDTRMNYAYQYAFENAEVIPVSEFDLPTVNVGFGTTSPLGTNVATARLRVYVAEADVEYYDIDAIYATSNYSPVNFDFSSLEDKEGYVTAIKLWPVWSLSDTTCVVNENRYPVLGIQPYIVPGNENLAQNDPARHRVTVISLDAPTGLELVSHENSLSYISLYKITGFDPNRSYEYIVGTGSLTALPAGATELSVDEGIVYVRYAPSEAGIPSEFAIFDVPASVPVFGATSQSKWTSCVISKNFVEGKWANYPNTWSFAEARVTSRIDNKFSDVTYKYQFTPDRYFKVDDYPWFAIDFNNELLNMNMSKAYIEGAVLAVDIYVVGEDTPYTVTTEWKGSKLDNYKTPNAANVNLLAEFPEIAGKTVYKFDIRPYANIDKTPDDFNTESTADHYAYFRLFYIGFFDTASNFASVAKGDGLRVNTLEGIEITGNSTYYIGDELSYTVSEVYSDGTKQAVEGVLTLPEGFATTVGNYTLSAEWRGYSASLNVETKAVELVSIVVNSWPTHEINKTYYEGDPVDFTGFTIKATYNNGKTEIIGHESITFNYGASVMTPGAKLTISYGGKQAAGYVLSVHSLDSITVTAPDETEYLVGETLVLDGMTVTANYSNGTTRDVTAKASVDTTALNTAGTITVTVQYLDVTDTFDVVVVNPVVLESITVSGGKTEYFVGETYTNEGVKVTANYSDGTTVDVTAEAVIGTADTAEAGKKTVTVTYADKTASFDVTVKAIELVSIAIETEPTDKEYFVGQTL